MKIKLYKGDDVVVKFNFLDAEGNSQDLTGQGLFISIYDERKKVEIIESELTLADGQGLFNFDKELTSSLLGDYLYFIRITNNRYSTIIQEGEIEILFAPTFFD